LRKLRPILPSFVWGKRDPAKIRSDAGKTDSLLAQSRLPSREIAAIYLQLGLFALAVFCRRRCLAPPWLSPRPVPQCFRRSLTNASDIRRHGTPHMQQRPLSRSAARLWLCRCRIRVQHAVAMRLSLWLALHSFRATWQWRGEAGRSACRAIILRRREICAWLEAEAECGRHQSRVVWPCTHHFPWKPRRLTHAARMGSTRDWPSVERAELHNPPSVTSWLRAQRSQSCIPCLRGGLCCCTVSAATLGRRQSEVDFALQNTKGAIFDAYRQSNEVSTTSGFPRATCPIGTRLA
jgi:hypothetical protein